MLGFIGQGGMGFVYKVEHMMMAKTLALKVLRPEQVTEEVWKRFRIEAQAIARLDHINVVRIYDMSQTEDGLPFYTMDLLDGESLADYLDEYYRLPLRQALPIFRQVCAGLAYAHDRGIVHRDIKPGNIMLLAEDKDKAAPTVKIVDFGIAKLSSFDSGFGQGLTRPGEVFGSPLYMSPEQCSGQQLDHRTDMYSVGVTMYQALTGRPPLLGKTAIETTAMHQDVVPPAMAEAIVLEDGEEPIVFPAELEEIVARLLAKSPDDRYDSLADVSIELLALERGAQRKGHATTGFSGASARSANAPHVVAGSARRPGVKTETQNLAFDQSETGGEANSRKQIRLILSVLAVVVLLTLGAGAVVLTIARPTPHVQGEDGDQELASLADLHQDPAVKVWEKTVGKEKSAPKYGTEQAKLITDYLAKNKQFYSTINPANTKQRVFEFPSSFSLGRFSYMSEAGGVDALAQGHVKAESASAYLLKAEELVAMYPALLERFRDDELGWLELKGIDVKSPNLLSSLTHCSKINRLVLTGSSFDSTDMKWLDKLPFLEQLEVSSEKIKGSDLANSRCLLHLTALRVGRLKNVSPLLKRLSHLNNLTIIDVGYTGLSGSDCKYLAKMTKLTELSLKGNELTDDDLKPLVTLQNLRSLDMRNCDKLTLKSAKTLGQLSQLREIKVPSNLDDPKVEQQFRLMLPNLRTYRGMI